MGYRAGDLSTDLNISHSLSHDILKIYHFAYYLQPKKMLLFKTAAALTAYISAYRNENPKHKIGFAPTMGALHQGHLSLIETAKNQNDITACSIFVNPTQFNDPKDLAKWLKHDRPPSFCSGTVVGCQRTWRNGRRARLRIWYRKVWGFKSPLSQSELH